MYKNYFFDLYGTLVDIRTDEQKPSLWRDLAEFYSLCGASYTLEEIRERYFVGRRIDSGGYGGLFTA